MADTVLIACGDDERRDRLHHAVARALDDAGDAVAVSTAGECRERARTLSPTLVVAGSPLADGSVHELLAELAGPPVEARAIAVTWPGDDGVLRGIGIRRAEPLARLVDRALNPGEGEGPDPQEVRELVARVRHDINNPLTSALAETQLLLMDHPGGEIAESLEQVQEQLRRIRDLTAELSTIPRPS